MLPLTPRAANSSSLFQQHNVIDIQYQFLITLNTTFSDLINIFHILATLPYDSRFKFGKPLLHFICMVSVVTLHNLVVLIKLLSSFIYCSHVFRLERLTVTVNSVYI